MTKALSRGEFVALTALLISLAAMSIDTMLPALGQIGVELGVKNANDVQLIVSAMFLGLAFAQLVFGPLSDGLGRKPAIYAGLVLFLIGSVLCIVANSFTMLLVGRALQGAGAAGPRVVAVAIARDKYKGSDMASIMSMVMAVFIIVPTLAPAIGQGILALAPWRAIFVVLLAQGALALLWFAYRQPETLPSAARLPLSPRRIGGAIVETCRSRTGFGYTIAAGLVMGSFLGYLSSAQQIFVDQYGVGTAFPVYFGSLALTLGAAALVNSRLVGRLGMRLLCWRALLGLAGLSVVFVPVAAAFDGDPPLSLLMAYLLPLFFCIGTLFGNFNALAMEPLGHIAGTASAVIGSFTTFIGLGFGVAIGRAFDGTVMPLVVGFAGLGLGSLGVMVVVERKPPQKRTVGEET